jgi:thymidylate synthase (FAD)
MSVKLVSITPHAEHLMAYCARVSSSNQNNPNYENLLSYCMKHGHWSVFEMADMTVEVETSRAVAAQLLRHKSLFFQEFSQRYSKVSASFDVVEARAQDSKNRQNSLDILDKETKDWFTAAQNTLFDQAYTLYEEALAKGIAKECARNLLPLATRTRLYMKGTIRSFIHYLNVRCHPSTQKEHRDIATGILSVVKKELPTVYRAMLVGYPHLGD